MTLARHPGARSRRPGVAGALALWLAVGTAAAPLLAYETDQYSNRLEAIADSEPVLDQRVNDAIARVAAGWRRLEDREEFARQVYEDLGGLFWVDHIERFAMKSPEIERLPQYRWRSVFHGAPIWASRVGYVFGVGGTIRLAGSLTGTDKLGHFFSQGFKYYRSHLAGWSDQRVLWRGRFNERWLFGQLTTSVYSNADLVANYEGYRFYRSLFEDGVVPGKPAIIRFAGGRAVVQRPFAWSDHVNDYWDEALNPSFLSPGLAHFMSRRLPTLCGDYREDPADFVPRDAAALALRYADIGLRPAPQFRMDRVCAQQTVVTEGASAPPGR